MRCCDAWHLAMLTGDRGVVAAIRRVGMELHTWSREVLGDLKNRIKKVKKEFNCCRKRAISQE